jgi:hypothetical protein
MATQSSKPGGAYRPNSMNRLSPSCWMSRLASVRPGCTSAIACAGDVIYRPPLGEDLLRDKLTGLNAYIDQEDDTDPLIKLAAIHYQFEAIHPFHDGNGRTGRILNILYLLQAGLLELPVLYLSRYVIDHKRDYYRLLRHVTETGEWEAWVLYMLSAVETTARDTLTQVLAIRDLMSSYLTRIRAALPQDLLQGTRRATLRSALLQDRIPGRSGHCQARDGLEIPARAGVGGLPGELANWSGNGVRESRIPEPAA